MEGEADRWSNFASTKNQADAGIVKPAKQPVG
jgi:hypothetical protein